MFTIFVTISGPVSGDHYKEYPRTIWVSPVIEAIIIILIMMVSLVSDLVIYALVTPDAALHADWMSHILPAWRLL